MKNSFKTILLAVGLLSAGLFLVPSTSIAKVGDSVDCSAAYQEFAVRVSCKVVTCDSKFSTFVGTWEGPFEAYNRALKTFRPYRNQVKYFVYRFLKMGQKLQI